MWPVVLGCFNPILDGPLVPGEEESCWEGLVCVGELSESSRSGIQDTGFSAV